MYEITSIDRHGESDGGSEFEELDDALRVLESYFDPENVMYYSHMELHSNEGKVIATLDFSGKTCKFTNYHQGTVRKSVSSCHKYGMVKRWQNLITTKN